MVMKQPKLWMILILISALAKKIAFVGRSGSGKTTAINLLPRFINPVAGEILLDNINIQEVNLANLRSQFALVSQEIFFV